LTDFQFFTGTLNSKFSVKGPPEIQTRLKQTNLLSLLPMVKTNNAPDAPVCDGGIKVNENDGGIKVNENDN